MKIKKILFPILCIAFMLGVEATNVFAATTVNVSTVSELQSAHYYADYTDKTWVYTHSTTADSLKVTFSSDTETEAKYDFIYILDGSGNQIGKYDGTTLAGQTITVPGNIVKIRLTSDYSNTKYGFRVTNIEAVSSTTGTVYVSTVADLQSVHTYANNMDKTWVYTHSSEAEKLNVTFSGDTETESGYDYIYILDGNGTQVGKYSGTLLAGKTITVPGKVVKIRLTSDGSQTRYGFRVTSITEASTPTPTPTPSNPSVTLTGFASGNGTSSSPYIINTATHLLYFAQQLNAGYTFEGEYIKLNANLDMTSYTWDSENLKTFEGNFDGNNKTITINTTFLRYIGEAGIVNWLKLNSTQVLPDVLMCYSNSGIIQNCGVRGNVIKSSSNTGDAGLLCRYNYGTVYNSYGIGRLSGYVSGDDCWVGWVLVNEGTIKSCYTVLELSGTATGKYSEEYINGIAAKGGGYENCYTDSAVIANDYGFVDSLNCMTTVSGYAWVVDTTNENEGYPVIKKCLNATVGLSCSSEPMFAFHSYSVTTSITSDVSGCTIYYTLDGTNPETSSTRRQYSSSLTLTDDFEIKAVAYKGGVYSSPRTFYGIKLYGSGTTSNPYQIKSNLGLYAIRFATDKVYSLESDLNFSNDRYITNGAPADGWTPIPTFTGTLDGKSHSITGISSTKGGLFASNSGTVKNLRLLNHKLCQKNGSDFGSIANSNSGTITRCYSSNLSDAPDSYDADAVGGIAGYNSGTVSYCQTTGHLYTGASSRYSLVSMGGIVGEGRGSIISCYSDIDIITPYSSHDLGATAAGMGGNSSYSYDCRYDGCIGFQSYDAFTSVGSAGFPDNESRCTVRCYDGGFSLVRPDSGYSKYHINSGIDCYKYKNSYQDYFESSCPSFDFVTTWMITPDGPMPQGVMNADGNYYTKKSYTAPTCTTDGSTVCLDRNNQTVTFKLDAYGHNMNEGCCTRCSFKEIYNIELKNNTNNSWSELYKDCSYQLEALLTPADAIDKTITWTSSDATIATVSQSGFLSCLNCGTVKITATANNGVKAEIELTIIETPYLNDIAVSGTQSAVVGDTSVIHHIMLSTNKDANVLYTFVRYPDTLILKSINAKDFAYAEAEDEYTEDGFTTSIILAQYSETDLMPKNEILTPFELTFDISKSAIPGIVQIKATEESCLIGNDAYFFEESIAGNLEILPKLAESIEISGEDVISSATTYTAIVKPDYTTDKSVLWSVDNEAIATVNENGVVSPVTSGTITLTATSKDGSGIVATKTIQVTQGVTGIEIAGADSITESTVYTANITPDYATNKEVEWWIDNEAIATIDREGRVTPVTSGLVTITATAKDGSGAVATKEINIIKLAEVVEITGEASITSPSQYTAIVLPDYTTDKEVSWSVDNEAIATVDENGIVTPVTSGTITLTATAVDGSGVDAIKTIEIVKLAESIEIVGREEITEPSQYSVVILPEYTTNKEAEWSVSDESVATVDENGVVTPLKNGKIVLTATAKDASGVETTKSIVITVSVRANSITSDIGVWDKGFDSDITEYTINVPVGTASVYLTSSFTNATAKVNGSIAANGVRKKVTLSGTETNVEIVLTPTAGNSLKANTYKITIVRGSFTKTDVSEEGKAFTVTPINIETGKTVILALYNGEQFVEMQSAVYTGEAVPFTTTKTYTKAKVMVWDSVASVKPVCNVETIN